MDTVIRKHVRSALRRLIKRSDVLWPGADAQLAEKNLSFYAGHELLRRGYTVVVEWPLNRKEHIDLVAWSPAEKTLVLLESKRTWRRSLELNWLYDDIKRLERAARRLGAWTLHATDGWLTVEPQAIIGVVLLGSNDLRSLDPTKRRRGRVNDVIRALTQRVGDFAHVAHKDEQHPYVLHYAAWTIKGPRNAAG